LLLEVADKVTECSSGSRLNLKGLHLLEHVAFILPLNDSFNVSHHFLPNPGCIINQLLKMLSLDLLPHLQTHQLASPQCLLRSQALVLSALASSPFQRQKAQGLPIFVLRDAKVLF